jgi:hypothetical protein
MTSGPPGRRLDYRLRRKHAAETRVAPVLAGDMPAGAEVPRLCLDHDVVVSVGRVADMLLVRDAGITRVLRDARGRSNKNTAHDDRQKRKTLHLAASFGWLPRSTEVETNVTSLPKVA